MVKIIMEPLLKFMIWGFSHIFWSATHIDLGPSFRGCNCGKQARLMFFFSHYPLEGAEIYLLILYIYMKADEVSSGENLTGKTETLGGAMHHVVNC